MRCASGELVVCHDERLKRLAGRSWQVSQTAWWKLQQADVGSTLGFAPAKIPLLEEVLEALPRSLLVNIELKCDAPDDRGLSVTVGRLLERRGDEGRVIVSSFNRRCLQRLAAAHPSVPRGLLIDPDRSWFLQAWIWQPLVARDAVHPHHSQVTGARVDFWHSRGLKVAVWTVDEVERARELEALGVDLLITNRPALVKAGLKPNTRL